VSGKAYRLFARGFVIDRAFVLLPDVGLGEDNIEPRLLVDLERAGVLTAHQVTLLMEQWPQLDEDWAASPYFGTVREHTRAYIERLANRAAGEDQ
jgi:hypothetical protein